MNTPEEPAGLRNLRWLVTFLTVTMIGGVLTIIALLVIRLNQPAMPLLPERITLPDGTTPMAITRGPDWWAIVTDDNQILIYAPDGSLRQSLTVD